MRYVSLGLLSLVSVLSVVLFLLEIFSPLPKLQKDEQTLSQTLSASHEKILRQTLLSLRLTDIAGIVSKRSTYGVLVETLTKALPKGMTINSFSVEKTDFEMTVSADNLDDLQEYFDSLGTLTRQQKMFQRVYLNSLDAVRNTDGGFNSFQAKLAITLN